MTRHADPSAARLLLAFVAARMAAGLTFLSMFLSRSRVPWYHPLERRWTFEVRPEGFAMDWYGRSAIALAVGLATGGAVFLISRRVDRLARPSVTVAMAHAAGFVVLVDVLYFGFTMATSRSTPLPLPPWYCAG